jgi:hypothetical protein
MVDVLLLLILRLKFYCDSTKIHPSDVRGSVSGAADQLRNITLPAPCKSVPAPLGNIHARKKEINSLFLLILLAK